MARLGLEPVTLYLEYPESSVNDYSIKQGWLFSQLNGGRGGGLLCKEIFVRKIFISCKVTSKHGGRLLNSPAWEAHKFGKQDILSFLVGLNETYV